MSITKREGTLIRYTSGDNGKVSREKRERKGLNLLYICCHRERRRPGILKNKKQRS